MKTSTKHSWILIVIATAANIIIFSIFSKKLEGLVVSYSDPNIQIYNVK